MSRRGTERRSGELLTRSAWAGVVLMGTMLVGCGSSDPNKPLTEEQGAALVKSVRNSPPQPDDLSPAEKKYLKHYLAK